MMKKWFAAFAVVAFASGIAAARANPRVAVFDFELIDTSLEGAMSGPRAEEQARLKMVSGQLRQKLAASGKFDVVDIGPVEAEALASNLQACGGCDNQLAKKVGAELSMTGTIQKVSDLILNLNLYVRDVASSKFVTSMSADFRGNTDESWTRALDYLVRNRLLQPNFGAR